MFFKLYNLFYFFFFFFSSRRRHTRCSRDWSSDVCSSDLLWESRYLGRLVRGAGYIRNDLELDAMLTACRNALAEGNSLIIFPEGTRSVLREPMHLRRGFANIATLLQARIQLVTITCNPPTLIKGENWWTIPPRRPLFRVEVGDCLDAASSLDYKHRSLAVRKLVRRVEDYYAARLSGG